jgi:phenylacetate-coenzyme A ligase PaaK-like adenylate-forming protein
MGAGIGTVADPNDTVLILLPDGRPNSQADLLYKGVKKIGATPVVDNVDLSAEKLFGAIKETRCAVIFGYTRKLFRLTRELQTTHDLRALGVRVLFLAAEYLPDAMRHAFQSSWGSRIHTHYGLTEMGLGVAVECEAGNGYHFNEADLLLEIVDPRTGEVATEGDEGELVFTTLNREAMPLLRYRTHDLSRLIPEPCACGATSLLKIDRVKKRLENIVIFGSGDEIYPAFFDDLLFEIPGLVDYQVTVTNETGKDRLDFKIELLPNETTIPEITKKLLAAPLVAKNLSAGTMAAPRIELAAHGSLAAVSREKKMILDRR